MSWNTYLNPWLLSSKLKDSDKNAVKNVVYLKNNFLTLFLFYYLFYYSQYNTQYVLSAYDLFKWVNYGLKI